MTIIGENVAVNWPVYNYETLSITSREADYIHKSCIDFSGG